MRYVFTEKEFEQLLKEFSNFMFQLGVSVGDQERFLSQVEKNDTKHKLEKQKKILEIINIFLKKVEWNKKELIKKEFGIIPTKRSERVEKIIENALDCIRMELSEKKEFMYRISENSDEILEKLISKKDFLSGVIVASEETYKSCIEIENFLLTKNEEEV